MNEDKWQRWRELMVSGQLEPRGIRDARVLEAFRRVPRHLFVPEQWRDESYEDHPVTIGEGQTISQPYMVALMTECLELRGDEKVLEVGTGSGYQSAILAELCAKVITIERHGTLSARAKEVLDGLGYTNIKFRVGDGTLGAPDTAPFDRIIVTASAPSVPEPLAEQLADGGIMALPVGGGFSQELIIARKRGSEIKRDFVCGCVFVPLVGKHGYKE
jgi:protein-L-isoaspartate(D-aspartate) O-methyltransferase